MELNSNFQRVEGEGGGSQTKNLLWGWGLWIFSGITLSNFHGTYYNLLRVLLMSDITIYTQRNNLWSFESYMQLHHWTLPGQRFHHQSGYATWSTYDPKYSWVVCRLFYLCMGVNDDNDNNIWSTKLKFSCKQAQNLTYCYMYMYIMVVYFLLASCNISRELLPDQCSTLTLVH